MESLEDIRKKLEYLEHIKKQRAVICLKYYHKRIANDQDWREHLNQKARERYQRKKQRQQTQS